MKRKLSLLLLAALATFALCAPLSLAQEEEPVTLTWFQTLDAKASASMQSMDESPTWQLIQEKHLDGGGLLGFGDGYVEIQLTKQVGGYAIAVATNEAQRDTSVNAWKRERLMKAGADCVIPDFTNTRRLMDYIFGR